MVDVRHDEMASAIEALLLDDDGIPSIALRLGGFNVFEAMGHPRSEERHSDFLAFLLDPNEAHGLGAEVLRRLVVTILKSMRPEDRPISPSEVMLTDFESCQVLREHRRIDVLCVDESHRFLLAIENKIGSGEHSGQLPRYRSFLKAQYGDFRRILAYLTPDKREPLEDKNWTPVSYTDVLSIVELLAKTQKDEISNAVALALDHYAVMLRRNIVIDDDLVSVARTVYRKHRAALDFIFEQKPDDQLEMSDFAQQIASEYSQITVVKPTKSYIRFFPTDWEGIPAFNATHMSEWTRTGHSLLFEIENKADSIRMTLTIGPIKEGRWRSRIFEFARSRRQLFRGIGNRRSPGPNFARIYSTLMVNRRTLNTQPIEEVKLRFESTFKRFMDNEFGRIVSVLAEEFAQAGTG